MKSVPIGRRTRRQLAIKENELRQEVKRRWFAARTTWRNRLRRGVKLELFHDDDDHDHSDSEARHLYYKVADHDSDDSLKLIGERWNPDHCYEPETDTKLEDTKCCPITGIRKRGRPRKMTYVDTKSEPRNDFDPEPETCTKLENNHMLEDTKSREIACTRTSGRLQGCTNVENTSIKLENDTGGDNAGILGKRKRGRPPKNRNAEEDPRTNRKPNTNQLGNVTPSTLLDKGSAGMDTPISSVSDAHLPLKFSFRVQNLSSEMSSEEEDIEGLFCRLDVSLRLSDVSGIVSGSDEDEDNDEVPSYESVVVQAQLCRQGKHYLILDDEIGIRCQSCSFVKLEIRDVTPDFNDNPFGKSGNKNYNRWIPYNKYDAGGSDRFRLPRFSHNLENVHSENFRGTV